MTTEKILTDPMATDLAWENATGILVVRAIEQAVLQSPEIQALRKDAERWRAANDHWRVIKVEVRLGAVMHNASGIPWSHLVGQVDATISAAMEQQK